MTHRRGLAARLRRLLRRARAMQRTDVLPYPVQQAHIAVARADYRYFVQRYFAAYATAPLAEAHHRAALAALLDPQHHAVWMWFRGAAKSTHANLLLPLWLRIQAAPQVHTMVLVGKRAHDATRLLADLRTALTTNALLRRDFGFRLLGGRSQMAQVRTRCGFAAFALGAGQSPRGLRNGPHRPDYIVADDLDHASLCRNPSRVRHTVAWLLQDLLGTLDASAHGRFLLVGNRFAPVSVLGTVAATGRFHVHRWDALDADDRPTWPAKYGSAAHGTWLHQRRALLGWRAFQREYQNEPLPEGAIFRPEWLRYTAALPWADYRQLVVYIDPSFTHTPTADFKAAKLWGLAPGAPGGLPQYHLLRSFVRRAPLAELVRWCFDLHAELSTPDAQGRVAAVQFWLEGNLLQDILLQAFDDEGRRRGIALPLRADKRAKPPKAARIEALAGLYERGQLHLANDLRTDPDTQTGLEQLLSFGPGSRSPDDSPDADEGALFLLQRHALAPPTAPLLGPRRSH